MIGIKDTESVTFEMTHATEDWIGTILHFQIIELTLEKCLLRFEHRGWAAPTAHFRRTSYCWAIYLRCLKNYLEYGKVIAYEDRSL